MRGSLSKVGRFATVLVLAGAIVAGTYAFTAANTVPASHAGDGSGAVTGYTVTNVHYTLNANPATIDSVAFTVDRDADGRVDDEGPAVPSGHLVQLHQRGRGAHLPHDRAGGHPRHVSSTS